MDGAADDVTQKQRDHRGNETRSAPKRISREIWRKLIRKQKITDVKRQGRAGEYPEQRERFFNDLLEIRLCLSVVKPLVDACHDRLPSLPRPQTCILIVFIITCNPSG
jgi:hypothetical protein